MSSGMPPSVTLSSRFFIAIGVTEVIGSTPATFTSESCSTNARMPLSSSFRCSTSSSLTAMRAKCAMRRTVAASTDMETSFRMRGLAEAGPRRHQARPRLHARTESLASPPPRPRLFLTSASQYRERTPKGRLMDAPNPSATVTFANRTPLRIGAVGLRARDLSRLTDFYSQAIGLDVLDRDSKTAHLGAGGVTLLEIEHAPAPRCAVFETRSS